MFFDKWEIEFEVSMDTDVAICEILKVQLDVADIDTAKGEKMPDGGTTSVLQFIFKQAEA